MAKYLEVAEQAGKVAERLMRLVEDAASGQTDPEVLKPEAAEMAVQLVNFGIRCSPRGVHHTIRLRACQRVALGLPVKVSMQERTDERTRRTYNVLVTEQKLPPSAPQPVATVEEFAGDEE